MRKGESSLNKGDKLQAKWSETFIDHTTKGRTYEVVDITEVGFWIINDKGKKHLPVSTSFTRVD